MKLSVVDETAMPPALDAKIRGGLCTCFPRDVAVFRHTRPWHDSPPQYSVLAVEGDEIIAHAGVVGRTITVGDVSLRVAGIQNVYVLPSHRGQGLSGRVLAEAMAEAARRQFDCGLLFCEPALERIYAGGGWHDLGPRQAVRIEAGREMPLPEKNITMFFPLRLAQFPDGLIHLRGNDW
jgi:GNAT superfamily N-acetyltransferase